MSNISQMREYFGALNILDIRLSERGSCIEVYQGRQACVKQAKAVGCIRPLKSFSTQLPGEILSAIIVCRNNIYLVKQRTLTLISGILAFFYFSILIP